MRPDRTHTPLLIAALLIIAPAARGQLDPNGFTSLGTLNVTSGTLTIDTTALTMSGAATFTGVAVNQSSGPQVAVFDFSSITIGSGVTVNITGTRPLALLSLGNASVQTTLSVNAFCDNSGFAGGYGGVSLSITANQTSSLPGNGPGGGTATNLIAAGGGFGGAGGSGLVPGGQPYGNLFQVLQGGSGGGGFANTLSGGTVASADSGAGGGAVEVTAVGTVSIASRSPRTAHSARPAAHRGRPLPLGAERVAASC